MQVFTALYNTDDNCLVAAPTGSGKTACAEFAVLRMISQAKAGKCVARCVYIAPMAALAKERFADWTQKFGQDLGLNVTQLTGETQVSLVLCVCACVCVRVRAPACVRSGGCLRARVRVRVRVRPCGWWLPACAYKRVQVTDCACIRVHACVHETTPQVYDQHYAHT